MAMANYKEDLEILIDTVVKEGASDLHLTAFRKPTLRVFSNLIPLVKHEALKPEDTEGILKELVSHENFERFKQDRELDFAFSRGDHVRFRCNAFYQRGVIGVAMRLIATSIQSVQELNLPPILSDIARREQGLFLVVGPVGQGKSTTLAAMVNQINQERAEHIVTIEDPIEYLYPEGQSIVDQREVRYDTDDFHTALQSMFRQDVNVALIGEMRGQETMSTTVTAAETGHLIFSTLHTNNAAQTIDRIIDSFPANQQTQIRVQLAGSLIGIFSQRLVARISGGLIPAYELLLNNKAVANLIREGKTHEIDIVLETGAGEGMIDLNHSLADLVRRGEITSENASQFSLNPAGLGRLI